MTTNDMMKNEMENLFLNEFTQMMGLKVGYAIRPRWFPQTMMKLSDPEKEVLIDIINTFEEKGLINIKNEQQLDPTISITEKGMDFILNKKYEEKYKSNELQEQKSQTINIGVLNSANAQVGNNNTMTINNGEIENKISDLINEIKKQSFSQTEEQEYIEIIQELKEQLEREKPKRTIVKSLLDSLPKLGSIASIGSMILAML